MRDSKPDPTRDILDIAVRVQDVGSWVSSGWKCKWVWEGCQQEHWMWDAALCAKCTSPSGWAPPQDSGHRSQSSAFQAFNTLQYKLAATSRNKDGIVV